MSRTSTDRILVVATNWIGDAVMNLPFIEALRERYPQSEIHVLCRPWVEGVFHPHPCVTGTIVLPDKTLRTQWRVASALRARRFGLAYVLPNSFRSALIPFLAGVRVRVGYRTDLRRFLLTRSVPKDPRLERRHEIFHYLNLLGISADDPRDWRYRFHVTPEEDEWATRYLAERSAGDGPIYGLNPGATFGSAKQWGADRFAAVGRWLAEVKGARVLIFGSPAERDLALGIAADIGASALVTAGETSLRQAAALIQRCRCLITNDTGTMHIAAAAGTRVIAIFGSTNPLTTYPYGEEHVVVREPVSCSPCMLRECPIDHRCMTRVNPDQVLQHLVD